MASPETPKSDENPAKDDVEDAIIVTDPSETPPEAVVAAQETRQTAAEETRAVPESPRQADAAPTPARRGGAFALFLGGMLAAGAGFGLSRFVPEGWPIATGAGHDTAAALAAQSAEIAALKAALAELPAPVETGDITARMDALQTALSAAEAAASAAAAEAAAATEAAASRPAGDGAEAAAAAAEAAARAEAAAAAIAARPLGDGGPDLTPVIEALAARVAALEAAPPGTAALGADPAASDALQEDITRLREELAAQQAASAEAVAAVQAAAAEAQAGVAAARTEAEALRAAAKAEGRATLMRAALARVQAGVETGAPFASAVDELVAGGITVPEALLAQGDGVPSHADLQAAFPEAARAALAASLKASAGDGTLDRFGAFLRTQTGARSLEPREGSDPDAVLSRAEALVKDGQIGPAKAEISALPEAGQAAMGPWLALAQARLDAEAALADLAAAVGGL